MPTEQMPMMNLLLKGLKVKFVSDGYIISGRDIIPEMVGETSSVPNPNFPFKTFEFKTVSDDMVSAIASFRVGDRFEGEFSGGYMPR